MKTLYLECQMGAAGDMLAAALFELLPERNYFLKQINQLGLEGVSVICEPSQKCGILGTHMRVVIGGEEEQSRDLSLHDHNHNHHHAHGHSHHSHDGEHHPQEAEHSHGHEHQHFNMQDISRIIEAMPISETVKKNALAVYRLIAEAESHAHGVPVEQVHFHEVGSMDAVADVVSCCLLMEMIGAERICASPVALGSGFVRCAHGTLPVPAPATAYLLQGVPSYAGTMTGELCTPTGAALLKYFVHEFGAMPLMQTEKIGYGMGTKDFEAANCLRAFMGESLPQKNQIYELTCNLDDMTPEAIGYASEILLKAGALDVFTTPIQMKKNRPAEMLTCLCSQEQKEMLALEMLRHTTTLGVREKICFRTTLTSHHKTVCTEYGEIRIKISSGHSVTKAKPEYDDVYLAAQQHQLPFSTVFEAALAAYMKEQTR